MPAIFKTLDKVKPVYEKASNVLMLICKLLLVTDILITAMAVAGRLSKKVSIQYLGFALIPDPAWSEEIVLSCMVYLGLIGAAIALRKNAHIRMTALDSYLPKKLVYSLDILADLAVMLFSVLMIKYGWEYANTIGGRGTYVSMPWLSLFWKYIPVFLAGIAAIIFEIELLYTHIRQFFVKEEAV